MCSAKATGSKLLLHIGDGDELVRQVDCQGSHLGVPVFVADDVQNRVELVSFLRVRNPRKCRHPLDQSRKTVALRELSVLEHRLHVALGEGAEPPESLRVGIGDPLQEVLANERQVRANCPRLEAFRIVALVLRDQFLAQRHNADGKELF